MGAVDLYSTDPFGAGFPPAEEVAVAVVEPMAELLGEGPAVMDRAGLVLPEWLVSERAAIRMDIWIAVGMVMQRGAVSSPEALALLRSFAYGRSQSLDEVGQDVLEGRVPAASLFND